MKTFLLAAAAGLALLTVTPPAGAVVYVKGTGEPAFTNTTTNTQFVEWQGSSAYEKYQLEFDYYDNNVLKTTLTSPVSANGSGSLWADWQGVVNTLQEGHTYGICAYGRYWIGGVGSRDTGSCFHADQTGKRAATTIDRTKPAITVTIDGGAAYSRTAKLTYNVDYTDNLAFPFPANFLCRDIGADPATACASSQLQYNEACSVPLGGMKKVTYFNCNEDLSSANVGDVPVTLCVKAADAAIPDNPYSDDQSRSASTANLSDLSCDSIQIDRTPPQATIVVAAESVTVGDPVSVSAQASDATSGLDGAYAWSWGDNTGGGAGQSAAHTYTAAGTYQVAVVTKDKAGNETTATRTIVVNPRKTGTDDNGGGTTTAPTTVKQVSQSAGGGPTHTTDVGGLDVLAPKRVKLGRKARTLAIALTAEVPGRASLALVRGGRIHAQGSTVIAAPGTVGSKLRLPKKLKTGAYQLKISFQPQGAAKATSKTIKLTVEAAKKRKVAAKASARVAPRLDAASAPVAVPTGEMPAMPKSRNVRLPLG